MEFEKAAIFRQGVDDFRAGIPNKRNPFGSQNKRLAKIWNVGWRWGKRHKSLKIRGKIKGPYRVGIGGRGNQD